MTTKESIDPQLTYVLKGTSQEWVINDHMMILAKGVTWYWK